jgi:vanillate O-demethylase ferredoxin subunit
MTLRVARKWREADDIFCFELADPDGRELPFFTAGSHIDVEVAAGLVRQYSLCNAPVARDRYQIGVLRETESRGGTTAMIDTVRAGAGIRVSRPRNHFALNPAARHSILIAGGIGVTPILCMAEHLAHAHQPFEMHYGVRAPARAAFRERIAAAPFVGQVALHFDNGPLEQRLDLDAILANPGSETHLYVCGPRGLIEVALKTAKAKGWPDDRVHREFFGSGAFEQPVGEPTTFHVNIASSDQTIAVSADQSILQVLADAGIDVPFSCEQGVCGTCIVRVLEGEPDHRDFFMTPGEQARNDQMTVCCSRSKSALLILDL